MFHVWQLVDRVATMVIVALTQSLKVCLLFDEISAFQTVLVSLVGCQDPFRDYHVGVLRVGGAAVAVEHSIFSDRPITLPGILP